MLPCVLFTCCTNFVYNWLALRPSHVLQCSYSLKGTIHILCESKLRPISYFTSLAPLLHYLCCLMVIYIANEREKDRVTHK